MDLPENARDIPEFIQRELPVERFPQWNERLVESTRALIAAGYSREDAIMHMLSMVVGAVCAIRDIEGAE